MGRKLVLKKRFTIPALAVLGLVAVYWQLWIQPAVAWKPFEGKMFPDLSVADDSAKDVALLDLIGKAPNAKSLVALWATWCEPCIAELPVLEKRRADFEKQGYKMIFINYDGGLPDKTIPEVKAWLIAHQLGLKTLFDFRSTMLDSLAISSLPFAIRTDAEGRIAWMNEGLYDWEKAELP